MSKYCVQILVRVGNNVDGVPSRRLKRKGLTSAPVEESSYGEVLIKQKITDLEIRVREIKRTIFCFLFDEKTQRRRHIIIGNNRVYFRGFSHHFAIFVKQAPS